MGWEKKDWVKLFISIIIAAFTGYTGFLFTLKAYGIQSTQERIQSLEIKKADKEQVDKQVDQLRDEVKTIKTDIKDEIKEIKGDQKEMMRDIKELLKRK